MIGLLAGGAVLSVVGAATWVLDPVRWEASAIVRLKPSDCSNLVSIVSGPLKEPTFLSTEYRNPWLKRWWDIVRDVSALNEPQGTELPTKDNKGYWPPYAARVTVHQSVRIRPGEARELISVAVIRDRLPDAVSWANFVSARLVSEGDRLARKHLEDWIQVLQYQLREFHHRKSNPPAISETDGPSAGDLITHTNRLGPFKATLERVERDLQALPATYRILRPAAEPATPVHLRRPLALNLLAIGFALSGLGLVLAGFVIAPRRRDS